MAAAISGRAARDVRRLVGVPGLLYVGNHGLERLDPSTRTGKPNARVRTHPAARTYRDAINRALDEVGRELEPRFAGLRIERKGVTGSIHVRNAQDPLAAEAAAAEAMEAAAEAAGLRVTRGKMVVELRPPVNVDKGTILTELIREYALAGAVFLGDDVTDIDGFRALRRLTAEGVCRGVAIAVRHAEAPVHLTAEADIALDGVEQVPELLRWMLAHAPHSAHA
jgi:trehalose 6-phosphate phosphatase